MAINYNPTTWVDNTTPVNAQYLNNIEQGIVNATSQINTNTNNIATNTSTINQHSADIAEIQQEISGGTVDEKYINFMIGKPNVFATIYGDDSPYGVFEINNVSKNAPTPTISGDTYTYTLINDSSNATTSIESIYIPDFTMPSRTSGVARAMLRITIDNETTVTKTLQVVLLSSQSNPIPNCSLFLGNCYSLVGSTSSYKAFCFGDPTMNQLSVIDIPFDSSEIRLIERGSLKLSTADLNQGTLLYNPDNPKKKLFGFFAQPVISSTSLLVELIFEKVSSAPSFSSEIAIILRNKVK